MSSKLFVASAALLAAVSAQAAVSVSSTAFNYSQNFDSLSSTVTTPTNTPVAWTNDSTIAGWSLYNGTTAVTSYRPGPGNETNGAYYSFGAAGSSDRALGSIGSSGLQTGAAVVGFKNDSGVALDSFTLKYDGEQWRNGGNASQASHKLTVQYGFGSSFSTVSSWINAGAGFDFTSPVTTPTAGPVVGNTAGLVANLGGTVTTTWAAGQTLWVRWNDVNDAGNDHGLAIDNVSFSVTAAAVPEPSTYAMLLAGLGAVGFIARRRRA